VEADVKARFVETLTRDLESGVWDAKYGEWRGRPTFEGSLRMIVGRPGRKTENGGSPVSERRIGRRGRMRGNVGR